MNKYYQMLELYKIFHLVQKEVVLDKNKESLETINLLTDFDTINDTLNEVDEAVTLIQRMGRFPLFFHTDLTFILTKVHKFGVLTEEELLEVEKLLDSIKENYLYLERLENAQIETIYYRQRVEQLTYHKELNLKIKSIITPFGEIKDDASSSLKDIRRKQKELEKNIQNKLQEILQKNADKLTQNVVSIRNGRYVIPVRADSKNIIKGIIHDQSASGETVFIEPNVINELNNSLNQNKEDEKREIYNILRNISLQINEVYEELTSSYNTLLALDLSFAKASYAINIHATKPMINQEGIVDLLNCRHPLLKVDNVVSNNISIGKNYKGIVITGPNTGGKTVLLKTVGLLSLMVKAGMLIPCAEGSNIMIFDDVYADIGDEQSIDQNLSTFSSHLTNVIEIISKVTKDSLVLLDELGSGTDPLEGAGLAISIFDYLINRHCLVVATSHYSELKIHAYNSQNIINASVEFDEVTLKPTYKLLMGVPGMSNALKIAKTLGLKPEIINEAQSYLYKRNDNLNQMLDKLVKQSHELDKKLKELEESKKIVNVKIKSLDEECERIRQEEAAIINKANIDAKKLIDKSMTEINDLLAELKTLKNRDIKLHEIAEVTHKARNLENNQLTEKAVEETKEMAVNDQVYVKNYDCYGTINKILKNDMYEVQIGIASIKVNKKNLQLASEGTKATLKPTVIPTIKAKVSSTLDLRGQRYEEASVLLDKFIDDAIYANLTYISIIHGFGTGVIRKLVHDTLKTNKAVESYRYGGANEGGQGVTIVTLKK